MLINSISEFRKHIDNKTDVDVMGLVPTMGALHEGHLSLIKAAKEECDAVVVSIYVNPTQFNNAEDLSKYPRNLEFDLKAIDNVGEDVLVYVPQEIEVYPNGTKSEKFDFGSRGKFMEGRFRKGHFDGVGTVLKRLFDLIKPDKAYFGEKDFQQLSIVKKLVEITGQKVEIIACETYREENGLAKSSRNNLLTEAEKMQAGIIYDNLMYIKTNIKNKSITDLKNEVEKNFSISQNFDLEYVEIADEENLEPTLKIKPKKKYRAFIAAYCSGVRLIDNMSLN